MARRSRSLPLLLAAALATGGCDALVPLLGKTPFSKRPDTAGQAGGQASAPALPPVTPVTSATIGPEGGTLATRGFSLVIPAGAVAAPTKLSLGRREGGTSLEAYRTAPVWVFDVPPGGFQADVRLTLDVPASSGGARYILVESENFVAGVGPARSPMLMPAYDETVRASVTFPAAKGYRLAQAGGTAGGTVDVSVVDGLLETKSPGGHFLITHPASARAGASELGFALEEAYRAYEQLGVGWANRTTWPVAVQFVPFPAGSERDAEACPGDWHLGLAGVNHHYLRVNLTRLTADRAPLFKGIVGHELMHLAQAAHDPRWGITQKLDGLVTPAWLWLDEALSTWFEATLLPAGRFPSTLGAQAGVADSSDNYAFLLQHPLDYTPGGAAGPIQEHGYGASMFLSWLSASRVTPGDVAGVLKRKAAGDAPFKALESVVGAEALPGQWTAFASDWLRGAIYPGIAYPDGQALLGANGSSKNFLLSYKTGNEPAAQFTWRPEAYTARLYTVSFANAATWNPRWPADTPLTVRLEGAGPGVTGFVQRATGGKDLTLERLGTIEPGKDFTVEQAEALAAANGRLFVMLAANAGQPEGLKLTIGRPSLAFKTDFSTMKGVIGKRYTFEVQPLLVPPTATYTWSLGEASGHGVATEQAFTAAGTYPVVCEASWPGGSTRAETSFIVAPDDQPASKVEVNFDVWRSFKSGGSSSKQRCNDYTIQIFSADGKPLDGGSSVARNGAWELNLVPGRYQYEVQYRYTMPPDSGKKKGTFEVKADPSGLGFVSIETPAVEV